jgi:hypothetical protein
LQPTYKTDAATGRYIKEGGNFYQNRRR